MASRSPATRSLWSKWGQLRIISRVLYLVPHRQGQPRLIVPKRDTRRILDSVHHDLGHAGQRKTEAYLRQRYWWFSMHNDVIEFCRGCTTCATLKPPVPKPKAPLHPIAVEGPNHRVGLDIIGSLPESRNGNRYILVMVDYLTKWCEAVPIKQQDTRTIAAAIVSEWISRFGVPAILHSDQGPAFESHLFRQLCNLIGVQKTRTTPYHPEGNGLVERTNRTIKKILSSFIERYEEDRWDESLSLCMLAYRSSVHDSTGYTPAFLQLGRDLRLPSDADLPLIPAEMIDCDEFARQLRQRMFSAIQIARENISHAQQHQKTVYDRSSHGPIYAVNDYVLLHRPKPPLGAPTKFHHPWIGPYIIVSKRQNNTFAIRNVSQPNSDVQLVHYNQLKPCPSPTEPQPSTSYYLPPVAHTVDIDTSVIHTSTPSTEDSAQTREEAL